MERPARNRSASFKIELTGDENKKNTFMAKMQPVRNLLKNMLNRPVTNSDILNALTYKYRQNIWNKYIDSIFHQRRQRQNNNRN